MVRAEQCLEEIFDLVIRLRGTLSGEHGVGSEKRAYVGKEIECVTMALMKEIKRVFDPRNILNPGKLFPQAIEYAMRFLQPLLEILAGHAAGSQ